MGNNMNEMLHTIPWLSLSYGAISLAVGLIAATFLGKLCYFYSAKHTTEPQARTFQRLSFYTVFLIFVILALQQLGFKLGVLIGAAGVVSIAIGFASQNSLSNMISGIFLSFERPFRPGDTIQVKGFTGEVLTIDLLSTKIRQFDNTLVRIPNEAILKAEITNLTHFKTRRIDLIVGVAYRSNTEHVTEVLLATLHNHPEVLKTPEPIIRFDKFAESSVNFKCFAWVKTAKALPVKAQLQADIKQALEQAEIEIPYPHLTLTKS